MEEGLYNLAFERSILSSIIFEPTQFDDLETILKEDDFYLPAHKDIYKAIAALVHRDEPIDEEFIKKAVQLCLVADPKPWNGLPDFKSGKLQDLDIYDPSISAIPNEKKIKMAIKVEKTALNLDKRITKTEGGYCGDSESEVYVVNSKGISRSSSRTFRNPRSPRRYTKHSSARNEAAKSASS